MQIKVRQETLKDSSFFFLFIALVIIISLFFRLFLSKELYFREIYPFVYSQDQIRIQDKAEV